MIKKEQLEQIMVDHSYTHEREGMILNESWFGDVAEKIVELYNLQNVSKVKRAVCTTEKGKCISQKQITICTRKEHYGFKQTDC